MTGLRLPVLGGNAFNWGTRAIQVFVTLGWGHYAFVRDGVRRRARERAA